MSGGALFPASNETAGQPSRAVYEHIASGRKTPVLFATAEDGHHEVKSCEAVLKSSRVTG